MGFLTVQTKVVSLSPSLQDTGRTEPSWDSMVSCPKLFQLYVTLSPPCSVTQVRLVTQVPFLLSCRPTVTLGFERCSVKDERTAAVETTPAAVLCPNQP